MSFKGNLKSLNLSNVLQMLSTEDKTGVLSAIRNGMTEKDTWQGKALGFPREALDEPPRRILKLVNEAITIAGNRSPS